MSDEDGAAPRWCIKDDRAFLLRCSLHAPVLGGVILVLGICATTYVSDLGVYGIAQLPVALTFVPIASVLGAIFGIVVGAVPGMLGGAALLFLSHFRAPTTFEFLAVAAAVGALLGLFLQLAAGQYAPAYLPLICAGIAVLCALLLLPGARRRGVIVPYDASAAAQSSAPA